MPDDRGKVAEFEFHDHRGWLGVSIDRDAFEKVFKAVQENADFQDLAAIEVSEVWQLSIDDSSRRPKVRTSWRNDRLALLGCGVVIFIVAIVFIIGILAIVGLVPLPR